MNNSKQDRQIADTFRVLSVETRVRIVRLLAAHGPLCVGALAQALKVSSGAVSQHLRVMRDKGLVEDERRGYYIHYKLTPHLQQQFKRLVDDLFGTDATRQPPTQCHHKGPSPPAH